MPLTVTTPAQSVTPPPVVVPSQSIIVQDSTMVTQLESEGYAITAPGPVPPPPTALAVGSYDGNANVAGVQGFGTETGKTVHIGSDYQDGSSWTGISAAPSSAWHAAGLQLALGVPMLPNGTAHSAGLAAGAAGEYDQYFVTLAKNLIAAGQANAILRIAWEWDGSWNAWYVGSAADAANFKAYWIRIVNAMRSVSGQNFNFNFYFGNQGGSLFQAAYPGDAYVTSLGLDQYDQSWVGGTGAPPYNNTSTPAQSQFVWQNDIGPQLTRLATFAEAHSKTIFIGEWGVIARSDGHGLGDDPTYINNMVNWMVANAAGCSYFDFNSGGNSILKNYPNSLAAVKASAL